MGSSGPKTLPSLHSLAGYSLTTSGLSSSEGMLWEDLLQVCHGHLSMCATRGLFYCPSNDSCFMFSIACCHREVSA